MLIQSKTALSSQAAVILYCTLLVRPSLARSQQWQGKEQVKEQGKEQVKKIRDVMEKEEVKRLEEHEATQRRDSSGSSVGALYRMAGTVWCGQGDGAATVYSLGGYSGTDRWGLASLL